jgi:dipeptidyl aminopeptidase/acylaminoacyl peptidase
VIYCYINGCGSDAMMSKGPKIITKEEIPAKDDNLQIYKITYKGDDDNSPEVEGVIAKPLSATKNSLPLVVYNTPGTKSNGTGYATTNSTIHGNIIPYASNIGKNGSIVVSSSLREKDEYGGADVQDILEIMEIGKRQSEWDGKNVIMIGLSRGAMMTYLAIVAGTKLTGAVIVAGETDLYAGEIERAINSRHGGVIRQNDKMIPGLEGKLLGDRAKALKSRSAIAWPEKLIDTPMLIIHGEKDDKVLYHHAEDMDKALTKAGGKNHKLKPYPECGHGILFANRTIIDPKTSEQKKEYYVEDKVLRWCNERISITNTKTIDSQKIWAEKHPKQEKGTPSQKNDGISIS